MVHSGPDTDWSLTVREGRYYCCTDRLNVRRCATLESVDVAVVGGCQKEGRYHILELLDNLEVAGIAAMKGHLGDFHRCLGAEYLQRAVADCLVVRRKMAAGHKYLGAGYLRKVGRLKACHNLVASLRALRRMVVVSCMIEVEVGSESTIVVKVGCMIEIEVDSGSGSIGSEGEGCMMNELFR